MSEPFTPDQQILDDELGPCDLCGNDGRWLRNGGCICDTCHDALRESDLYKVKKTQ
jgi:hypothetical protein